MGLKHFGDEDVIEEIVERFRKEDEELLRLQAEHGMQEGAERMRKKYEVN